MKMNREYIRVKKPAKPIPFDTRYLKKLDDEFWKNWIFYYLLDFYKTYDSDKLKVIIENEGKKRHSRIEEKISKFIRNTLNANGEFGYHFTAIGESTNDEEPEGFYDIIIHSTNWKNKNFHFECKNLDGSQTLINKYVCYPKKKQIYDGGVLRFFNGKYAQKTNFGGMIGFVIKGNEDKIKKRLFLKLKEKLATSPEGDLIDIIPNSIKENTFTFNSVHNRFDKEFTLHHFLFDFTA